MLSIQCDSKIKFFVCLDRVNEFSDEDEENEFSSGEYDPNNIGGNGSNNGAAGGDHLTGYDAKRGYKRDLRKYRKIDQTENDGENDGANPVDSDSEFENLKEKGARVKISHVNTKTRQTNIGDKYRPQKLSKFNFVIFLITFSAKKFQTKNYRLTKAI